MLGPTMLTAAFSGTLADGAPNQGRLRTLTQLASMSGTIIKGTN
ncbi:hypothetical protein Pla86_07340 [Planctomycetes bacterium Pla86]|uniref:Uncharacterized protein n=1 Tax=Engelhardtia mirabilis TaxID=2528011 RepID=A0A518BFA9_9BACT|nr:hypothetical protein Pla133_07350 [Planctomycetes bacterium Pla133]QDU99995.1 hypothetical protein Pla86_07340 [Planctomycetes bacterium Pla86]